MRPTDKVGTFRNTSGGVAEGATEEDVRVAAVEGAMEDGVDEVGEVDEVVVEEAVERPCCANVRRRIQAKKARSMRRDDMAAGARKKVRME